jgi:hypothetical protein
VAQGAQVGATASGAVVDPGEFLQPGGHVDGQQRTPTSTPC